MHSFNSIYTYPAEDLCLFKNFPHNHSVLPILIPGIQLACTCTIYWLQSYYQNLSDTFNITNDYTLNYQDRTPTRQIHLLYAFCDSSFDHTQCNFVQRFNNCITRELSRFSLPFTDTDILYLIKWLQFIMLTILQPLFSVIGLVNNFLIILVIKNRNKPKSFKENMYKYILINACFNFAFCLITLLKLINTCVFYYTGIFCSSLFQQVSSQYFKLVSAHFLGNVMKMCSNFSYLSFSLSRLLLITTDKKHSDSKINSRQKSAAFRLKFSRIYFLLYFLIILIVSTLLNVFKLFQYEINQSENDLKDFPYELRDESYCQSNQNDAQCGLFRALKILNQCVNDIFCVILNVIIDLVLVYKFKKHLKRKLSQINDIAQRKNIEKSKKSINRMVLVNGCIYVLSHLPEFLASLLLIVFAKEISKFCTHRFSCDLVNEEAASFSLISIVCQFYVFKVFDKNFKQSFRDLKTRCFCLFSATANTKTNVSTIENSRELVNLQNLIGNGLVD
jgi:hypothetical protein